MPKGPEEQIRLADVFWKLPMIWRVTLGIIVAITAILLKYLTEVFHVSSNSWTAILIGTIYFLAGLGTLLFLRRKLSH